MGVSSRHIFEQGPVLRALGRTVLSGLRNTPAAAALPDLPGPEVKGELAPPSKKLIDDYVRFFRGDPRSYRGLIPPHLFPQWSFPLAARTLEGLPYPMLRVVNGGSRMEVHAPLPAGERLSVRARLEDIEEKGKRAILHTRVVTSIPSTPDALTAHFYAIVPRKDSGGNKGRGTSKKEKPRVPEDVRELVRFRFGRDAGLSFAKLTGDFNPIHWVGAYAKASGFRDVILHGFGTFAFAAEGLTRALFSGDPHALHTLDVRFTRPLVLPADVGLFVADDLVFVGEMPGGPAYMTGRFDVGEIR